MEEPQVVKKTNPLLERIKMPGETVRLPSGGVFYKNGELSSDVKNGEVHVYPMSTYDEIVFKSPDKLINGTAVDEVFRRCIPDIEKPLELFAKDIDYLTMALKRVTFGPIIEMKYNHRCSETAKEHSYTHDINNFMKNAKIIDPTKLTENYKVVLPNGQTVEIMPTRFKNVIQMLQDSMSPKVDENDLAFITSRVLSSVANVIDSVDEVTDKEQIKEWLEKVGAGWMKYVTEAIEKAGDWGVETAFTTKCKDCGTDIELEVPLNPVTFFI